MNRKHKTNRYTFTPSSGVDCIRETVFPIYLRVVYQRFLVLGWWLLTLCNTFWLGQKRLTIILIIQFLFVHTYDSNGSKNRITISICFCYLHLYFESDIKNWTCVTLAFKQNNWLKKWIMNLISASYGEIKTGGNPSTKNSLLPADENW